VFRFWYTYCIAIKFLYNVIGTLEFLPKSVICTYYGTHKYNLNTGKYFIAHQANKFLISLLISYELNFIAEHFFKKTIILNDVFVYINIINLL
jgi:hypothetical protein